MLAISDLPPPFGGLTFAQGRRPAGAHEVALDRATAGRHGYHVGDLVPIVTGQPVQRFRISGLVRLGGASLGRTTFAVFVGACLIFNTFSVTVAQRVQKFAILRALGPPAARRCARCRSSPRPWV
jgi:hypothetical protein